MTKTEDLKIQDTHAGSPANDLRESFLRDLGPKEWRPGSSAGGSNDNILQSDRQSLELNLIAGLDPVKDQTRIKSVQGDLDGISDRVKHGEITAGQAAETFRQAGRLLFDKASTNINAEERQNLAEQILSNAAKPAGIDQGIYNTCNVTAGEVLAYSRTPERAAALVADVALSGKYTASYNHPEEGPVERTVEIDPTPHGQSKIHPQADGCRNHASEIFQTTAVNLVYNASDKDTYRYRVIEPDPNKPWDTGERFEKLDRTTGSYHLLIPEVPEPPDPNKAADVARAQAAAGQTWKGIYQRNFQPNVQPAHMGLAAEIITGERSPQLQADGAPVYLGDNDQLWAPLAKNISSLDDLYDILKSARAGNEFPRMATVNVAREPFKSELGDGPPKQSPTWHNITIHGLEERPGQEPRVLVSNQWGDKYDHLSWNNAIPLSQFFDAMRN